MIYIIKMITEYTIFLYKVKVLLYRVVPPSLIPFLAPQLPLLLSMSGVPTEKTFKAECLLS